MARVTINGVESEARLPQTILGAARERGIEIPTFCWHEELSIAANCRMCLVEVEGSPKLLPACQTELRDGMKVQTESPRVRGWRRQNLEYILLQHPVDCPTCDQAGECRLQEHYQDHDKEPSRLWSWRDKLRGAKREVFGPHVIYDAERCILCTLCVRFCEEVWGRRLLDSTERGNRRRIVCEEPERLDFPYSLMTAHLCPVGALTSRDFRFRKRAWLLSSAPGVCPGCAKGCAAWVDHEGGVVYRLRPREDREVNRCWLCDEGVLAGRLHNEGRLGRPFVRRNGTREEAPAAEAAGEAAAILSETRRGELGVVLGARATCEENLALARFAERLELGLRLYVEGAPAGEADKLLRCADRSPNRAGALRVAQRFGGAAARAGELADDLRRGAVRTLVILGGDGPAEAAEAGGAAVVCVSPAEGGMTRAARAGFPAPSFAQTAGTYVSEAGLARRFGAALGAGTGAPPQVWETLSAIASKMGRAWGVTDADAREAAP